MTGRVPWSHQDWDQVWTRGWDQGWQRNLAKRFGPAPPPAVGVRRVREGAISPTPRSQPLGSGGLSAGFITFEVSEGGGAGQVLDHVVQSDQSGSH